MLYLPDKAEALRAVIRDGRIAEWHVYADNEPMRELPRTSSAKSEGLP